MDVLLKKEDFIIQIRDKLRKDSIKLWLQPYYDEETGLSHEHLKNLASKFSECLSIPEENCYETLIELQKSSLENLKQSHKYRQSGLATIKIKILHQQSPTYIITKEVLLSMSVNDFKVLLTKEIHISFNKLKLIYAGKVLADSESLGSQGVKNGQQVLALTLAERVSDLRDAENQCKELEATKTDSNMLALDDEYMQLEDQFGNVIRMPEEEKKALIIAMTLQEKGRSALKRHDYSKALVYFLEADEEFRRCNSKILETVDNYALLDLDIAWCYLNLQSVSNLPEAYERLKRCEQRFNKSYGQNLERVIAVKGAAANEAAFFMRLHLLQAIVLYHKNQREEALNLLRKAKEELAVLKVDETSVMVLVELGYTIAEARLGLRANQGDVNRAANYIKENRDKRAEARKKALAEEIFKKKQKKLGKCIDGKQYVNPSFVNYLVNMGYNKEVARIALKQTNNIISDSIQYIQEHPEPGPSQSKSFEFLSLINDLVPELVSAGFDASMAKIALQKHSGDIMKAAEDLLANNGVIEGDISILSTENHSIGGHDNEVLSNENETDKGPSEEEKQEAFKRLADDITIVDDDHLDLTLHQEEAFLTQYLALLENK